jgi:hypothetical protein
MMLTMVWRWPALSLARRSRVYWAVRRTGALSEPSCSAAALYSAVIVARPRRSPGGAAGGTQYQPDGGADPGACGEPGPDDLHAHLAFSGPLARVSRATMARVLDSSHPVVTQIAATTATATTTIHNAAASRRLPTATTAVTHPARAHHRYRATPLRPRESRTAADETPSLEVRFNGSARLLHRRTPGPAGARPRT